MMHYIMLPEEMGPAKGVVCVIMCYGMASLLSRNAARMLHDFCGDDCPWPWQSGSLAHLQMPPRPLYRLMQHLLAEQNEVGQRPSQAPKSLMTDV